MVSKYFSYLNLNVTCFLDKHTHPFEKYDIEKDTRTTKWHSFSPNNAWVNYAMVSKVKQQNHILATCLNAGYMLVWMLNHLEL